MDRLYLLESFFDSHPDPVVITRDGHTVLLMNRAAKEFSRAGGSWRAKACSVAATRIPRGSWRNTCPYGRGRGRGADNRQAGQRTYMRAIRDSAGKLSAITSGTRISGEDCLNVKGGPPGPPFLFSIPFPVISSKTCPPT